MASSSKAVAVIALVTTATAAAAAAATAAVALLVVWQQQQRRKNQQLHRDEEVRAERALMVDQEKIKDCEEEQETLPSILEHFQELRLEYGCSVQEANQRRTTKYYQLARDAHVYDLCVGVRSYPRLRNRREAELARIFKHHRNWLKGVAKKSHRTVIVMTDAPTATLLTKARDGILSHLQHTTDITTTGVWIPAASMIPAADMHVTVAIPWWWHTVREANDELSRELVARFRQALVLEFHHAFQLELERIVLLGGKTLVALWRCVGERLTDHAEIIYDRHGEGCDPFVKLRRDIVRCFTSTEDFELMGKEPLTYAHRFSAAAAVPVPLHAVPSKTTQCAASNQDDDKKGAVLPTPPVPPRDGLVRQNTIELKTPGLGDHDGFIHTTLARLPLDCLAMHDVELETIHRLCREATAQYCGHRLVVNRFRFLETTGAGGESNPCVQPLLDETIAAPPRVRVDRDGAISEHTNFIKNVEHHVTIGAPPTTAAAATADSRTHVEDLFPAQD